MDDSIGFRASPAPADPARRRGPIPYAAVSGASEDAPALTQPMPEGIGRRWQPREATSMRTRLDLAGARRRIPGLRSGDRADGAVPTEVDAAPFPLPGGSGRPRSRTSAGRTLPLIRPKADSTTGRARRPCRCRHCRRSGCPGPRPRRVGGRSVRVARKRPPSRVPEGARLGGRPKVSVRKDRRGDPCALFPRGVRGIPSPLAEGPAPEDAGPRMGPISRWVRPVVPEGASGPLAAPRGARAGPCGIWQIPKEMAQAGSCA
jgi:hypothetical protein